MTKGRGTGRHGGRRLPVANGNSISSRCCVPDDSSSRVSQYHLLPVAEPETLVAMLTDTLGVLTRAARHGGRRLPGRLGQLRLPPSPCHHFPRRPVTISPVALSPRRRRGLPPSLAARTRRRALQQGRSLLRRDDKREGDRETRRSPATSRLSQRRLLSRDKRWTSSGSTEHRLVKKNLALDEYEPIEFSYSDLILQGNNRQST
jgi:hypothetical protein